MAVSFNKVYPRPPLPLTPKTLDRFPFFLDSRRKFFGKSWEEGAFEKGSVTMLLGPRIFGKTSFINMLPTFLMEKGDERVVQSYSCMDTRQLEKVQAVTDEMLSGGENRVLILDEMNYAIQREPIWRKIERLAGNILQMKGRRQTIILTTSETSSSTVKEAFDVLHPGILRLPALSEDETKTVARGVLKEVSEKGKPSSTLIDLIWRMSGGIPPYIRISLLRALKSLGKGVLDPQMPTDCMFDFFENLDAIKSCIQTLESCPVETEKMAERDMALMADQFCLLCPIGCRTPSVKQPVVETILAKRYGLVFAPNTIAAPVAFYFNDHLGRKSFEEFSSDLVNREEPIRTYVNAYGRKEFVNDILVLLEIAFWDPSFIFEEVEAQRLFAFFREKAELVFLEKPPSVHTLTGWIKDFNGVCKTTVFGDKGIDIETRGLKLAAETPAINAYVQCKNWRTKLDLKEVGIFHKFEMVLRNAKQIHSAILVSTSEINQAMRREAELLTSEHRSVFSCWSEPELTTVVSAVCGKREGVHRAIKNLSRTKLPTKIKGGALEYLALKVLSIFSQKVFQH